MDNFSFKGISSTSFNIIVNSLPPISKPAMRVEETEIDGVDGTIFEDLGYESYDKKIKITITENNIDKLISWLNGEGNLVLSNEPDKYYKAKVISKIDFERLIKYEPVEVTFRVQPFKYKNELKEFNIAKETSIDVYNLGNTISKPIITITGTGNIEVSLNGNHQFTLSMIEDNIITLDSEKQDAYYGTTLKNRKMNGEFINLNIGKNQISWTGSITKIEINNQSRWI